MVRWCYRGFALVSLILLGWGAYVLLFPPDESTVPPILLVVDDADRELGIQSVGEQILEFRLTNRSGHPLRVSGPPFG